MPQKRKHIVKSIILGIVAIGLIVVGTYTYAIVINPSSLFNSSTLPSVAPTSAPSNDQPTVTPIPEKAKPKIVNVLLMGLDRYGDEGLKYSGSMFHADVMMVAAINFEAGTVDLISLPRDTLTHVPGIKGIYKLNAAVNMDGGNEEPTAAGFDKACQAAEWMLGGINIDYYYALQFDTVINLVDSIGGIDFDVDIKTFYIKKGMQHMDGTKVLAYLRARTDVITGGANDKSRVNRQKKMMVAIFDKLKANGLLASVPTLIDTASNIYTNTTTEQTLAIANFMAGIKPESIGQYSLSGEYRSVLRWNFTIVDQANRVAVIKEVYNLNVPERTDGTFEYGNWLKEHGFAEWKYMATADRVYAFARPLLADDAEQKTAIQRFYMSYEMVRKAYALASVTLLNSDTKAMEKAMKQLKTDTIALAKVFAYPNKLDWTVEDHWWFDPDINEVKIDFR